MTKNRVGVNPDRLFRECGHLLEPGLWFRHGYGLYRVDRDTWLTRRLQRRGIRGEPGGAGVVVRNVIRLLNHPQRLRWHRAIGCGEARGCEVRLGEQYAVVLDRQREWVWKTPYGERFPEFQVTAVQLMQRHLPMEGVTFSGDGRTMREPFVDGSDFNALDDVCKLEGFRRLVESFAEYIQQVAASHQTFIHDHDFTTNTEFQRLVQRAGTHYFGEAAGAMIAAIESIPRVPVQADLSGSNLLVDERTGQLRIIDFERIAVLPWLTDILWLAVTQMNKGSTILMESLFAGEFDDLLGSRPWFLLAGGAYLYKKASDAWQFGLESKPLATSGVHDKLKRAAARSGVGQQGAQ